jgi:predicted alpha/beta-fold hydrolase
MRNGFCVVSFVARGCGGIPLTTAEGFTAARYSDLEFCLRELKLRFPTQKICCVGFSLGAGILLNYLGRAGRDSLIAAAVAVSPSWNFLRETKVFEWWSRYYLISALSITMLLHTTKCCHFF